MKDTVTKKILDAANLLADIPLPFPLSERRDTALGFLREALLEVGKLEDKKEENLS